MRRYCVVLLCTAFVIFVAISVVGCVARGKNNNSATNITSSPQGDTTRLLGEIQDAIIAYTHAKKQPPKSLGALQGRWDSERIRDAWGNEIAYSVGTDSTVRLWSFGADKQIGGTGDDADILVTFHPFAVPQAVAGTKDDSKHR